MTKQRVHEYAKSVKRTSKEVIDALEKLNVNVKNHMSTMLRNKINQQLKKATLQKVVQQITMRINQQINQRTTTRINKRATMRIVRAVVAEAIVHKVAVNVQRVVTVVRSVELTKVVDVIVQRNNRK